MTYFPNVAPDYTLPKADGSDLSVLQSDGAGSLSFQTVTAVGGFQLIQKQELGAPSATVTFSSIPSGPFNHLSLYFMARDSKASTGETFYISFNGDATAANYDTNVRIAYFPTASNVQQNAPNTHGGWGGVIPGANSSANYSSGGEITIFGYNNATFYKRYEIEQVYYDTSINGLIGSGNWKSLATINSLTLWTSGTAFIAGSVFILYGIG